MEFKDVYITKTATYFPNEPISNDEMEEFLGLINKSPSKSKRIVLRNNGIKNRFYALDKQGKAHPYQCRNDGQGIRTMLDNDPEADKRN